MSELERVLSWCEKQVGTTETPPGSNNVVYNTMYYGNPVSGPSFPWCMAFIWCAFAETGLSALLCGGEKTAYCPYAVDYAKLAGLWIERGYQRGDLVFFDWNGDRLADHVGIVVSVAGSAVTTIEGNVDEAVRRMTRSDVNILGAYRPAWNEQGEQAEPSKPADDHLYTVKAGDSLWSIAEKTLGKGEFYFQIKQANNMRDDMIYPGQVLIIPHGDKGEITISVTITDETFARLKIMAAGWGKTIGQVVDALMKDGA